uniref:Ion_trans domain-containing protein n=1 Tax=Steinernema glaseri TaxID=37863 RepID=A0A1I7YW08_9BILA
MAFPGSVEAAGLYHRGPVDEQDQVVPGPVEPPEDFGLMLLKGVLIGLKWFKGSRTTLSERFTNLMLMSKIKVFMVYFVFFWKIYKFAGIVVGACLTAYEAYCSIHSSIDQKSEESSEESSHGLMYATMAILGDIEAAGQYPPYITHRGPLNDGQHHVEADIEQQDVQAPQPVPDPVEPRKDFGLKLLKWLLIGLVWFKGARTTLNGRVNGLLKIPKLKVFMIYFFFMLKVYKFAGIVVGACLTAYEAYCSIHSSVDQTAEKSSEKSSEESSHGL